MCSDARVQARMFVHIMHGGFPEFGVFVNPAKTKTNFSLVQPVAEALPTVTTSCMQGTASSLGDDTAKPSVQASPQKGSAESFSTVHLDLLPWNGLLINCKTLELQPDLTRHADGGSYVSSSLCSSPHQ